MLGPRQIPRLCAAVAVAMLLVSPASALQGEEPPLEALKTRISSANLGDRPRLCIQFAERQLAETTRLYAAGELEKAQPALTDVAAYSELARDYAIQSRKYQKQTEIAVRRMTRKLTAILHSLPHDDQAPVQDAVNRLERARDDLLASMFRKGAK